MHGKFISEWREAGSYCALCVCVCVCVCVHVHVSVCVCKTCPFLLFLPNNCLPRSRMNEVSLVLKSVSILISSLKDAQKEHANRGMSLVHSS